MRRRLLLGWLVVATVSVPGAIWAFNIGVLDWRYQLAGLADPFLGRPSPGATVLVGGMVFGLILGAAFILARLRRRAGGVERQPAGRWRPRWWAPALVVAGAWVLGASVVVAQGGPQVYEGSIAMELGAPVRAAVEVPATCQTPVGQPDQLASVRPHGNGLVGLQLRDLATGKPMGRPDGMIAHAQLVGSRAAADAYPIPNVPDRPLPYLAVTMGDGTSHDEPPVGFLASYGYEVVTVANTEMTGAAELRGRRWSDPFGGGPGPGSLRWVNLQLPNDPWPPTITLRIRWTCVGAHGG